MKKTSTILVTLLTFFAAAAVTVTAQLPHDLSEADRKNSPDRQIKLLPKAAPLPDKKKKKGKTPAAKTASEYKFERIDHKPAYTFDKKTNPIIKEAKPKKKAAKKTVSGKKAAAAAKPAPKTQTVNTAGGEEQKDGGPIFPEQNSQQSTQTQPEE
jgi:hypothetical protein